MKYDFETIIDRKDKDAIAIDGTKMFAGKVLKDGFDEIPMWIADMNFATVPTIPEAIIERTKHPLYGYFTPTEEYYKSIIEWHKRRNGIDYIEKKHIGYENGVLGGVVSAVNVLASKGDNILLHAPTYIGFTGSLKNNGYNLVHSYLEKDENGIYRMNYEDMEEKIVENKIHVAIMCNPHNPSGRVWEKWELEKAMELYKKHNVYVISDEIWSDIILNDNKHIPTYSVSEDAKIRTATMYAPSKTFNLAGLVGSYHIIFNDWLRERIEKESSLSHYNSQNVLSMHGLIGAYKEEGHEWVDELREVIKENVDYAGKYIENNFEGVEMNWPQGTYMLYIDVKEWLDKNNKTLEELETRCWEHGVMLQDGRMFNGPSHLRLNLALPKSLVIEAFDRLDKYVFNGNW